MIKKPCLDLFDRNSNTKTKDILPEDEEEELKCQSNDSGFDTLGLTTLSLVQPNKSNLHECALDLTIQKPSVTSSDCVHASHLFMAAATALFQPFNQYLPWNNLESITNGSANYKEFPTLTCLESDDLPKSNLTNKTTQSLLSIFADPTKWPPTKSSTPQPSDDLTFNGKDLTNHQNSYKLATNLNNEQYHRFHGKNRNCTNNDERNNNEENVDNKNENDCIHDEELEDEDKYTSDDNDENNFTKPNSNSKSSSVQHPNPNSSSTNRSKSNEDYLEQFMKLDQSQNVMWRQLADRFQRALGPNQCGVCNKVLSCRSALTMHYRVHTG